MGDDRSNPDGHPRADTLPASQIGFNGRLRRAFPLLSIGANGQLTDVDGTALGLQSESPQPRVLRVSYSLNADDRALGNGNPGLLKLSEGVDGAVIDRSYVVPLQGLVVAVPAGQIKASIVAIPVFALTNVITQVSAYLSHGYLSRRWFRDAFNDSAVVATWPSSTTVAAPVFAVQARVTVLRGALVEPVSGTPVFIAGAQAIMQIDEYGLLRLQAGVSNTLVSIEWEIVE